MTLSIVAWPALRDRTTGVRSIVVVLIAAAGPLAIAALRLILPYHSTDDALATVAKVAAAPLLEGAVLWLIYLALLTLPLGVLIAGRQAIRARPVLGAVAAVIAWLGFTSLFASVAIGDYLAQAAPSTGTPNSTTAAILDALNAVPAVSTASAVFVAGHILGAILLGIALWRVVPRWAAAALAISQPLHLNIRGLRPQPRPRRPRLDPHRGRFRRSRQGSPPRYGDITGSEHPSAPRYVSISGY